MTARRELTAAVVLGGVGAAIVGTIDPQHLRHNVALAAEVLGG